MGMEPLLTLVVLTKDGMYNAAFSLLLHSNALRMILLVTDSIFSIQLENPHIKLSDTWRKGTDQWFLLLCQSIAVSPLWHALCGAINWPVLMNARSLTSIGAYALYAGAYTSSNKNCTSLISA